MAGEYSVSPPATLAQPASRTHIFALTWWLVVLLFLFGLYVAWDLGYLQQVFARDRSHLTKAIALLTIGATLHAAWNIIRHSCSLARAGHSAGGIKTQSATDEILMEVLADRLRAPVELGWFLVDLAIRLGLAGTIIGFILIFASLTGETIVGENALRDLLLSMSGGMGTALFTTLSGLIAATFLSIQYLVLGRLSEYLIAALLQSNLRDEAALILGNHDD